LKGYGLLMMAGRILGPFGLVIAVFALWALVAGIEKGSHLVMAWMR